MPHEEDLAAAMQQMDSEYIVQQQGFYYPQCTDTFLDLSEEDLRVREAMLLDDDDGADFAPDACQFDQLQSKDAGL